VISGVDRENSRKIFERGAKNGQRNTRLLREGRVQGIGSE
jgi:hypothetical protein